MAEEDPLPPPLAARLWLAQLLAEAEQLGLCLLVVDAIATPGREEELAAWIEERAPDEDDPA